MSQGKLCRQVKGLKWVAERDSGPFGAPRPRKKCRQDGLRFEKALAQALPQARHGQWLEFGDAVGIGWAQPDLFWVGKRSILVLEAKLSWTEAAWRQLEDLYSPLLSHLHGLPCIRVQVCKVLRPECSDLIVSDLTLAISHASAGRRVSLHWLGNPFPRPGGQVQAHNSSLPQGASPR